MKVLVTGGAGFIGSHIVDALLDGGATVRVVDSLKPSVHGGVGLDLDPRAELIVGDVTGYVSGNDTATAVLLEALWHNGF